MSTPESKLVLTKVSARQADVVKRNTALRYVWKHRYMYLMLIPAVIYYIVYHYVPMYGAIIAFKDFSITKGIMGSPWVGFEHFKYLFGLDKFWSVFWNTVQISLLRLVFGFPLPLIVALLLNEVRQQLFKRSIQTIIYLPHFISWVILGGLMVNLLALDSGAVNAMLHSIGIGPIGFMSDASYFRGTLIGSMMWKEFGWGTVIYMAALAAVNPQLYEAAMMDGANRWKRMLHITLPGIKSTIIIILILRLGSMMEAGFEQILILYNPAVYSVSDIIDTYVYRIGVTEGQFSVAAAVGLFKSVINFTLLIIANRLARMTGEQGIY
ncbi:protein lplB [Paenibacillus sp. CCS19]|uniref:ABC transporter permease n=1 Tax=Paenibacillus sp. CCS19 TaxID=3158387 RepID=UPI002563AC82|nr:ABC transporter permease subunit [Paenibacillus cellulosilyticus]GMK37867.1 protein lplB [Paenibacillus cellulosilyticus]